MAFKAQIKGLDSLLKKVQTKSKEMQEDVQEEIEDFGRRVVAKAKSRVPKDTGGLSQAVQSVPFPNGLSIVAAKNYAAFVEFGTGALVNVPAGLEDYAIQFKGKGIKQVNLPARPFLFNSFFEEKQSLLDNIKKVIAK
jgi:HK97 gp10 family phage protein